MVQDAMSSQRIILFDGVCNLCNGFIRFLLKRDRKDVFLFGSLQSEQGQALVNSLTPASADLTTIVFIDGATVHTESEAILEIARRLGGVWGVAWWLRFIPRSVRDATYRFIARHRYRVFGRREVCMIPTPDILKKFV
jgi:predicted DCC family thiol-disulfide oxidoreductase YuxK